jgi:hypothetical protein
VQPQGYSLTLGKYQFERQVSSAWSRAAILALMGCLLIPRGVELQFGTIMVDSSRILLALFGLMAAHQVLSGTVQLRATAADLLMALHVGIIALSAVYHGGLGEGLETAAAVLVDMGLAYFAARVFIRNLTCYRYYVRVVLAIAVISAIFGLTEMVTGYSFIRALYHMFFPKVAYVHLTAKRLSLYRATATFRADILFGLYCMTAFALAVYVKHYHLRMRRGFYNVCLALCALGVFASLSSGPWLGLALCVFCLAYGRIMKNIPQRWYVLGFGVALAFLLVSFASNRGPIKLIINYLTLSPQTGYIRLAMWESVFALIPDYWLLGWGWTAEWPRAVEWYHWSSIDSFYAVLLVRSGIFAVLTIVGFLAYSWYRAGNAARHGRFLADETRGWILGTVCLALTAITVDIFGNLIFATYFLLGAGQTLLVKRESMPHSAPKDSI